MRLVRAGKMQPKVRRAEMVCGYGAVIAGSDLPREVGKLGSAFVTTMFVRRLFMSVTGALTRSVQHWMRVLDAFAPRLPVTTIHAHETFELTDNFFDQADAVLDDWYQLDAGHYDLFLDDNTGTIHLANLSGKVNYANKDTRLVTWYGHDPARHEILLTSPEGTRASPVPTEQLLWFAWDTGVWTLYAHDGKAVAPVYNTAELVAELELDPAARIWFGWDGTRLDLFTVAPECLSKDLCAVFVGHSQTVGAVHLKGNSNTVPPPAV